MNKRRLTLLIVIISIGLGLYLKMDRIKLYFANERYYSVLSALYIVKPDYEPYRKFYEIFNQEGVDYNKDNAQVISATLNKLENQPAQEYSKIPLITHQIYFTSPEKPSVLSAFYIENIRNTFSQLDKLSDSWQHNIWTNLPELFPEDIRNISNVTIRNIDEFRDDLLYDNLINIMKKGFKAKAYFAESSDILRILALNKFGGIYKDMDYEIYNPEKLFDLMKKFDFIAGRERLSIKSYYGNAFMATKAHHPVIEKAAKLSYRNHHLKKDSPIYLKYPRSEFDRIYLNGPSLITIAYFSENNINGNSDVILPPWMIYNKAFADYKNNGCDFKYLNKEEIISNNENFPKLMQSFLLEYKPQTPFKSKLTDMEQNIYYNTKYLNNYPIIGADMFCGTWVPDNNFKKKYYWNIPFLKDKHD